MADATPPTHSPEEPDEDDLDDEEWEDDDEEVDDDEPPSPSPPARRSFGLGELVAMSLLCATLGAMLAGAAVGVLTVGGGDVVAARAPRAPTLAAAPRPHDDAHEGDAACAPQEGDPSDAGDGVMDELDDGPAEPVAVAPPAAAPSPSPTPRAVPDARPLEARAPTPTPSPSPAPRTRRVITSDDVPEGPAQGFVHGRPVRIAVTRLDGKPVELRTAAAYRRMRDAATAAGVQLRIVSGFRTMEHQQALYRAYRQGRGNLAALPGHSNHQSGHALDLNTSSPGVFRWLTRNARRFGFRRTVPTEPWHWEWW